MKKRILIFGILLILLISFIHSITAKENTTPFGEITYQTPENIHLTHLRPRSIQWSPDGKWIAFSADTDEDRTDKKQKSNFSSLYIIRPDGTELTRVTEGHRQDFYLKWSKDSKTVFYASVLYKPVYNPKKGKQAFVRDESAGIYFSRLSDLFHEKKLKSDEHQQQRSHTLLPSMGLGYFDISPDDKLLVIAPEEPAYDLHLDKKPYVRERTPLLKSSPMVVPGSSVFSPDGRYLAYLAHVPGIEKMYWKDTKPYSPADIVIHVHLLDMITGKNRLLYPDLSTMNTTLDLAGALTWVPDSKEIAFHTIWSWGGGSPSFGLPELLEIADIKGKQILKFEFNESVGYPVWSPDGRKIVFEFGDTLGLIYPQEQKIYYLDKPNRSLTFPRVLNPTFSPDGKRIACAISSGKKQDYRLAIIELK